ncbi:unnamed protein product [Timema podura]|uniref:Uncharacterized protein n=1 Tax=Timema podura TaxID=61482 RepID=A0ABN7NXR6_TIMPD|nr:unnamed protein product [Timema podura]
MRLIAAWASPRQLILLRMRQSPVSRVYTPFTESHPSSPEWDSNLYLPTLASLAHQETGALANYATAAVLNIDKTEWQTLWERENNVITPRSDTEPDISITGKPYTMSLTSNRLAHHSLQPKKKEKSARNNQPQQTPTRIRTSISPSSAVPFNTGVTPQMMLKESYP